jgi:hypothetical protein
MFRRAGYEHGLTLRVLASRSPVPFSTLKGWATGTAMPAWAIGALGEAGIPDDLLSLLLEPFGRHVSTDDCGTSVMDHAASEAMSFAQEHVKARSPDSPGGMTIVPQEERVLQMKARSLAAIAKRASKGG